MVNMSEEKKMPEWVHRSLKNHNEYFQNYFQNEWMCRVNPYIRFAQYSVLQPHSAIGPRIIYDYEIVYIKAGTADIVINGTRYHATQGDFFFFKPGVEHAMYMHDEQLVQPHIHFDLCYENNSGSVPVNFKLRNEMTPEQLQWIRPDEYGYFFDDFPDHMRFQNTLYIELLFFEVIYSFSNSKPFNELRLKWQFLRLLVHLLNEISWQKTKHNNLASERAQHIRMYLEQHLDRRITLQELSSVFHLDKSYISRCFHKVYNTSPIHCHLLLRISRAKNMIIYTNLSLSDIAEQNGFASLQDFSRAFRRLENVAPSTLRKNTRKTA
jgi:AraC-like DNA-binding protein/quercetin dioxygenase-like cupin family protein